MWPSREHRFEELMGGEFGKVWGRKGEGEML